mgnify:CR=1 FL=1
MLSLYLHGCVHLQLIESLPVAFGVQFIILQVSGRHLETNHEESHCHTYCICIASFILTLLIKIAKGSLNLNIKPVLD